MIGTVSVSMNAISVLGVSASSSYPKRPPIPIARFTCVARMPQRHLSISWMPWLPMSPLPVAQNQCQS
jgi:hypothetical protein